MVYVAGFFCYCCFGAWKMPTWSAQKKVHWVARLDFFQEERPLGSFGNLGGEDDSPVVTVFLAFEDRRLEEFETVFLFFGILLGFVLLYKRWFVW